MARLDPGPLRHLGQPFGCVLADHGQHPEPRVGRIPLDPAQQALVDEFLESVQDLDAQVDRSRADRLGGFEADAAAEYRAGGQQAPGAGPEQRVAPGNRPAQGLLALRQVTGAPDEQGQGLIQPGDQRRGRQELDPCRRQFERQGQAIEPLGDPGDGGRVLLAKDEIRSRGAGAVDEQPHRLAVRHRGDRRALLAGHLQRRDFELLLAADVQRRAAGHHDLQLGRSPQDRGDHGRRGDQVLEIIEQQQDPRRLQVLVQAVKERPITGIAQSDALRDRG